MELATIFNSGGGAHGLLAFAIFANLTHDFRQGLLAEANSSFLVEQTVNTSIARVVEVATTISASLSAYCETLPKCRNEHPLACSAAALSIDGPMLNNDALGRCREAICSAHPELLISIDIAGIGVQVSIVLLCRLVLTITTWLLQQGTKDRAFFSDDVYVLRALLGYDRYRRFEDMLKAILKRLHPSLRRFCNTILVALIEFLKALCHFSIAIVIAALVILHGGDSVSPLDRIALEIASGVGTFPVTDNLYLLASFNPSRRSWYLYLLTLCAWNLGFCVTLLSQRTISNIGPSDSDD